MSHRSLPLLAAALALTPALALAHAEGDVGAGLVGGLLHPILGFDHLVAMVAVGLWGAQLGMPLLVALPLTFPLMMALGALVGVAGVALPGSEIGVSLSAVGLGLAVVLGWRPAAPVAVALVAVFALFHGYAHGAGLPPSDNVVSYAAGFLIATGALHAVGIGIGELARVTPRPTRVLQGCGAAVAVVGLGFTAANLVAS